MIMLSKLYLFLIYSNIEWKGRRFFLNDVYRLFSDFISYRLWLGVIKLFRLV